MSSNKNKNDGTGSKAGLTSLKTPLFGQFKTGQGIMNFSVLKTSQEVKNKEKVVDTSSGGSLEDAWNKLVGWAYDTAPTAITTEASDSSGTPFASELIASKVHITVPVSGVTNGDLLAQNIIILAHLLSEYVEVKFTYSGWTEPEWDKESRLYLTGILATLTGEIPSSFAATSSPIDLTRVALWAEACLVALSQKKSTEQVRASVMPTNLVGGQSATRYLSKVYSHLRQYAGQDGSTAVRTLERCLKIFCRSLHDPAIALVRKQKIPWSDVLFKGAPTEIYKVKGNSMTRVVTPMKPSRSPWWHKEEAAVISDLVKNTWESPDTIRSEWVKLTSEAQHDSYAKYVSQVREAYLEMKRVSELLFSQSGHRKRYILLALTKSEDNIPKRKRQQRNNFALAEAFWKLNLSGCKTSVKWAFSPTQSLSRYTERAAEMVLKLEGMEYTNAVNLLKAEKQSTNNTTVCLAKLTDFWVRVFKPELSGLSGIPVDRNWNPVISDDNIFTVLSSLDDNLENK